MSAAAMSAVIASRRREVMDAVVVPEPKPSDSTVAF